MLITTHISPRLLGLLSALIVLAALALTVSVLSAPAAQAASAGQCISGRPCITNGYQRGHTITINFYAMYRYDGYNVLVNWESLFPQGFRPQPIFWVIERSFSWMVR
jgi:hypothetical protein